MKCSGKGQNRPKLTWQRLQNQEKKSRRKTDLWVEFPLPSQMLASSSSKLHMISLQFWRKADFLQVWVLHLLSAHLSRLPISASEGKSLTLSPMSSPSLYIHAFFHICKTQFLSWSVWYLPLLRNPHWTQNAIINVMEPAPTQSQSTCSVINCKQISTSMSSIWVDKPPNIWCRSVLLCFNPKTDG